MKKIYSLNLLSLFLLFSTLFIASCNTNTKKESAEKVETGKMEYPAEWMYNQRAYPNNYINKDAYREAVLQSKQILANRSPEAAGEWTFVGPLNTGGRVTDVAISPDNDDHLYVATATGGIFRSSTAVQTGHLFLMKSPDYP
ncbi:hypothetical protein O4H26_06825 [Aequorivita viscosa]|nr:hypothetical protein [Aequorivita viscosa]